jgi:hypothetical protein
MVWGTMGCRATGNMLLFFFLPIMIKMYLSFAIGRAPSPISPDNQFYGERPYTIILVMFPTHAVHTVDVILVDSGPTWFEDAEFVSVWSERLLVFFVEGGGVSAWRLFVGLFCQLVVVVVVVNFIIVINVVVVVTLINDMTRRFPSILFIMANAHSITITITIFVTMSNDAFAMRGSCGRRGGAFLFCAARVVSFGLLVVVAVGGGRGRRVIVVVVACGIGRIAHVLWLLFASVRCASTVTGCHQRTPKLPIPNPQITRSITQNDTTIFLTSFLYQGIPPKNISRGVILISRVLHSVTVTKNG